MQCPWGHPGSEWDRRSMTPLILSPLPHNPPHHGEQGQKPPLHPPPGDKGHGGGNGVSLAWSCPSTSLSPMGASRGFLTPGGGGLGAPPCFRRGIVAPAGAHKPPGKPKGEPGEGRPQNTPIPRLGAPLGAAYLPQVQQLQCPAPGRL